MLRLVFTSSILVLLSLQYSDAAKILGIFPLNGHSHIAPMRPLMEGLAKKGHQVTVVSHFPRKTPLANYKDISLAGVLPDFVNNMSYDLVSQMDVLGGAMMVWTMAGRELCKSLYPLPQLQELAKAKPDSYDLVITETFGTECFLPFAHHFRAPWISFSCAIPTDWMARQADVPTLPAYVPHMMTAYPDEMDFLQRTGNTLMHLMTYFGFHYVSRVQSQEVASKTFPSAPPLIELTQRASLLLSNSHFSLTGARPGAPAHVEVGGIHISAEPKPLEKDLKDVLDKAKHGVIYFSFGSMVKSETLPRDALDAMLAAFARLPQMLVLWKADPANFPAGLVLPKNVITRKWLEQRDVLAHPNIKLFVTHGGLLGTMEAVHCGVPMLGVPMFGDQMMNVKNYVRKGIAALVSVHDVIDHFETTLHRVLQDGVYKKNAIKMSVQFRDRPSPPLDTAIFWSEYVLRHGGAPQLRTPARLLTWYQVWLIDVAAFLIAILAALLGAVLLTCRLMCRCCKSSSSSKDIQSSERKVKKN